MNARISNADSLGAKSELMSLAAQMVDSGARMLLVEGSASKVAQIIIERVQVPFISCRAGPGCDAQIVIARDILGLTQAGKPKFVKSYGDLGEKTVEAFAAYAKEVHENRYPAEGHSYLVRFGELERLDELLKEMP